MQRVYSWMQQALGESRFSVFTLTFIFSWAASLSSRVDCPYVVLHSKLKSEESAIFFRKFVFWTVSLCTIFMILLTLWNSEQETGLLIKLFCLSSDFDETWWSCSYPCALQFHQVSSKLDEKQKSFINSPFFCSEFQSVSRIVKIIHSAPDRCMHYAVQYEVRT